MKKILNLSNLESVEVYDKEKCPFFKYRPFKKNFWCTQEEGFYSLMGSCYTKKELEDNDDSLIVENNVVFYKPHIKLTFTNGTHHYKNFMNYERAVDWGNEIAKISIKLGLIEDEDGYDIWKI